MKYHDKMMHGVFAGLVGGIIQTIYAMSIKYFHLTDREYIDYAEVLILGRDYKGTASIIGIIGHLVNTAVWGIIFSYIIKFSKQEFYLIKGLGLGIFIWLFSLGMGTMYKLPSFHAIPPQIGFTLLFGALLWGLVMSYTYKKLDQKAERLND